MQEEWRMKRKKSLLLLALTGCLCLGTVAFPGKVTAFAQDITAEEDVQPGPELTPEPQITPEVTPEPQKDGWMTLASGKKKYLVNGVSVKGLYTIDGETYYFNRYGVMMKNKWVRSNGKKYRVNARGHVIKDKVITVDGDAYYLDETGAVYKGWKTFSKGKTYFLYTGIRAKGLTKIAGKYYYFTNSGYMATGTFTVNGVTYYMTDDGVMERRKENSLYYDANNKALSAVESQHLETLETARKIVAQITTPGMSQSDKLYACFKWVMAKPYITRRTFTPFDGWPAVHANDHFLYGGGTCMADGAAFAYLACALGYDNVYMCTDGRTPAAHGWAEINGLVYDPLFAQAKSFSRNYGVTYGVYRLPVILHIKIEG